MGGSRETADEVIAYRHAFESISARLEDAGIDYQLEEFVEGRSVAEDVLGLAEDVDADLIVIGLRGRSPVGKLILGSNAQDILLNTSCPVLAVPVANEETG